MHVEILRLGHRVVRDERITTHISLVARLFKINKVLIAGVEDRGLRKSIKKMQELWGGNLEILTNVNALEYIKTWKENGGKTVHLTMYGERITDEIIDTIKDFNKFLIIIGSQKVPTEIYEEADINLSIGNQPHSELSAVTIFLYEIMNKDKDFLYRKFENAKQKIVPTKKSKKIVNED